MKTIVKWPMLHVSFAYGALQVHVQIPFYRLFKSIFVFLMQIFLATLKSRWNKIRATILTQDVEARAKQGKIFISWSCLLLKNSRKLYRACKSGLFLHVCKNGPFCPPVERKGKRAVSCCAKLGTNFCCRCFVSFLSENFCIHSKPNCNTIIVFTKS